MYNQGSDSMPLKRITRKIKATQITRKIKATQNSVTRARQEIANRQNPSPLITPTSRTARSRQGIATKAFLQSTGTKEQKMKKAVEAVAKARRKQALALRKQRR